MTTSTLPPEVEAYLAAVRDELDDLPAAERDDLLAEVEASLVDAATEGEGTLAARLGPPEEFAAELRTAAGLEADAPSTPSRTLADLREALVHLADDPSVRAVRRGASELAPIWWAARGYLAVAALAFAVDAEWSAALPLVPLLGASGAVGGVAAIAVAVGVSVAVGLAARRAGPSGTALALVNLAILVAAVPALTEIWGERVRNVQTVLVPTPLPGLTYDGTPVENIYPYTRSGRLLQDVLLYDGAGRPIELAAAFEDPNRRLLRTPEGKPIFHSFPIRYFEPGTREVAHPEAAPPVTVPEVATPPLETASASR